LKGHAAAHQIQVTEISEHGDVLSQERAATFGVLATIHGGLEEQPSSPEHFQLLRCLRQLETLVLKGPDKLVPLTCDVVPVDLAKQEKKLRKLEQKAEECLTREQAQKIIRKAEKAQRKINDAEAS